MRFQALQSDDLPLPEVSEGLLGLSITDHAKDRFQERTRAKDYLSIKFLRSIIERISLTREPPSWRKEPSLVEDNPDLYFLFDFNWKDSCPTDQGRLSLIVDQDSYRLIYYANVY